MKPLGTRFFGIPGRDDRESQCHRFAARLIEQGMSTIEKTSVCGGGLLFICSVQGASPSAVNSAAIANLGQQSKRVADITGEEPPKP
jgi:hypothetical protein